MLGTPTSGCFVFIHKDLGFTMKIELLLAARLDFLLHDAGRLVFSPVIKVRVHTWVVEQIDFLQVSEWSEVGVDFVEAIVVERNDFQAWIVLKEVCRQQFD